jgi:hypothetical protein
MQVGDKVVAGGIKTEITATAFDDVGVKVYTVKGSMKDYYEDELELLPDEEKLYGNNYQLRYEELKKRYHNVLTSLEEVIKESEELDKIIELMAEDIAENKLDEDICRKVKDPKKEDCYGNMYGECKCCVIEYYEKKAKE